MTIIRGYKNAALKSSIANQRKHRRAEFESEIHKKIMLHKVSDGRQRRIALDCRKFAMKAEYASIKTWCALSVHRARCALSFQSIHRFSNAYRDRVALRLLRKIVVERLLFVMVMCPVKVEIAATLSMLSDGSFTRAFETF